MAAGIEPRKIAAADRAYGGQTFLGESATASMLGDAR
jgi:hypothetical protein